MNSSAWQVKGQMVSSASWHSKAEQLNAAHEAAPLTCINEAHESMRVTVHSQATVVDLKLGVAQALAHQVVILNNLSLHRTTVWSVQSSGAAGQRPELSSAGV